MPKYTISVWYANKYVCRLYNGRECQTNESASDCDLLSQLSPMSVGVVNVFRSHAKRTTCSIWLKYIATYKGFFRMLHCFLKFAHGRLILSYIYCILLWICYHCTLILKEPRLQIWVCQVKQKIFELCIFKLLNIQIFLCVNDWFWSYRFAYTIKQFK